MQAKNLEILISDLFEVPFGQKTSNQDFSLKKYFKSISSLSVVTSLCKKSDNFRVVIFCKT